jgi:hypothetical protein
VVGANTSPDAAFLARRTLGAIGNLQGVLPVRPTNIEAFTTHKSWTATLHIGLQPQSQTFGKLLLSYPQQQSKMPSEPTISHFGFSIPKDKLEKVVDWYLAALAPINYEKICQFGYVVGIGANKVPDFWIAGSDDASEKAGFHLAFNGKGSFCSDKMRSHG